MIRRTPIAALALLSITAVAPTQTVPPELAEHDVIWTSPSDDAAGSMPLGNGDVGVNTWIEANGDLLLLIGKTDSWGDNGRLLKVGQVRVRADPPLLAAGATMRQRIRLETATVEIDTPTASVHVWVDANHPVIHVETRSTGAPLTLTASVEPWRTRRARLPALEVGDPSYHRGRPGNQHEPVFVEPDTPLPPGRDHVGWYHHNGKSVGPALAARLQRLEGFEQIDPLLHRTFGAVVRAPGGTAVDAQRVRTPTTRTSRLDVFVLTRHPATPDDWRSAIAALMRRIDDVDAAERRDRHERWWRDFWSRSWIFATSSAGDAGDAVDPAALVTRGYVLQRFMTACAGRGAYPIKFNGSIFTVGWPERPGGPDYRRWGAGYWWQNTRMPYLASATCGDFELLEPLVRMYTGDTLQLARHRTRVHLGHGGAFLNECSYFWGAAFNESYGWDRPVDLPTGINDSRWHRWEFIAGPELAWMMLDLYEHTLDERFLVEALIPFAREVLSFYDEHYGDDADGRILIEPAQALETWWDCTNPMPEIAGLTALTDRLLALPRDVADDADRALWRRLRDRMPPLPTRTVDGVRMLAPATRFADKRNVENPELYAVFPFRLITVGRPDVELGVEALRHRVDAGHFGWRQDELFMAHLGLAEEAARGLVDRASTSHSESRFPAFWGPNYDWVPDQTHGGVLMRTLQVMLMQTEGRTIRMLPAWPDGWSGRFRLHAPYRTVVEGRVEGGELVALHVDPPERRVDVVVMP